MPLFFSLLLVAIPLYVCERLLSAFMPPMPAWAFAIAILLPALALVRLSMRARQMTQTRGGRQLAWAGLLLMSLFSSLFVLTLLRDVLLLAVRLAAPASLAAWPAASAVGVVTLALLVTVVGLYAARRPRVVRVDIPITNLHEALNGFSIAQISDIHVGPTIRGGFVQQLVERVNALGADVVAVTGDLVDGSVAQLATHTAPLSGLAAAHGVYFVTGNHEYYSNEPAWSAEIGRLGIRVLKNEHVVISRGGAELVLAGVTDISAHHFDPAQRSDPARAAGCPAGRGAHPACPPAKLRRRCRRGGVRCSALGSHARRPVLALEPADPVLPALYGRTAPASAPVGVRQPWHRLLGTAQPVRCTRRNHAHKTIGGVRSRSM